MGGHLGPSKPAGEQGPVNPCASQWPQRAASGAPSLFQNPTAPAGNGLMAPGEGP